MKKSQAVLLPLFFLIYFPPQAAYSQAASKPRMNCLIDGVSPGERMLDVGCHLTGLPAGKVALRFKDRYAGVDGLSERIYSLRASDAAGNSLLPEIRDAGFYLLNISPGQMPIRLSYRIHLEKALDPSQYALCSSLGTEAGVLLISDLLPQICGTDGDRCTSPQLELRITPPNDWKIVTVERMTGDEFVIPEPDNAVFVIGKVREKVAATGATNLRVAIVGRWNFDDEEVFRLAGAVAREQASLMGSLEHGDYLLTLAPFPIPMTGLRSSGLAIGRSATLMLNINDDPRQSFAHFRRHLPHEMFHFYLPNSFQVRENFDWFWEGFTRYIAMLTLLRLHQIDQQEFFDSIGADYESWFFNSVKTEISLLDASLGKFSSPAQNDLVYRKGALIAALYDLELRWQSKGAINLPMVIRRIYDRYGNRKNILGNTELLGELGRAGKMDRFISDFISGARDIPIMEMLKTYGLTLEWGPASRGRARIRKAEKISGRQRAFLQAEYGT